MISLPSFSVIHSSGFVAAAVSVLVKLVYLTLSSVLKDCMGGAAYSLCGWLATTRRKPDDRASKVLAKPRQPRPRTLTLKPKSFFRFSLRQKRHTLQPVSASLRHVVIVDEHWRLFVLRRMRCESFVVLRKRFWEQECKNHTHAYNEDDKKQQQQHEECSSSKQRKHHYGECQRH